MDRTSLQIMRVWLHQLEQGQELDPCQKKQLLQYLSGTTPREVVKRPTVYHLTGFDKRTDRLLISLEIPAGEKERLREIVGDALDEPGEFPLSYSQAVQVAGFNVDSNADWFLGETVGDPNHARLFWVESNEEIEQDRVIGPDDFVWFEASSRRKAEWVCDALNAWAQEVPL